MTTEKEFWNLAGQYFRKELGISEDEQTIDEECVGCCRVQCDTELIERLSTEIHNRDKTIKDFKAIETKETDRLHEIIRNMDVTISDLMDNDGKMNGFLDEYRETVENRDKTIEDLNTELTEKQAIIDKITLLRVNEVETLYNLKAELCKEDSAVLMKVVDAIRAMTEDARTCPQIDHLSLIVKDYLDAPEGPPETPIDDCNDKLNKINMLVNSLLDGSDSDYSTILGNIRGLSNMDDAIDETPIDDLYKVTVTYAFLEMP